MRSDGLVLQLHRRVDALVRVLEETLSPELGTPAGISNKRLREPYAET